MSASTRARRRRRAARPGAAVGAAAWLARAFAWTAEPRSALAATRRVLRRVGPARLAAALLVLIALGAGWLWFRESSLVSVEQVKVTGVSGPGSARIRSALNAAAHTMTTLDVRVARLYTAVAPYPAVRSLKVATDFPHGLRIHVVEELPVAMLTAGGHRVAVSADGTVLRGLSAKHRLPLIPVHALPVQTKLTDSQSRQELAVLAGAPPRLKTHVALLLYTGTHGVVARLRAGPSLYFGSATSIHAKWLAAIAVLANPGSAGAAYIDLTDPMRPAAG